uniref:Uncharacterized protein n=1 Tax=Arundo donax TaxID=35708 RepID=A0A0A9EU37_ARUDO
MQQQQYQLVSFMAQDF